MPLEAAAASATGGADAAAGIEDDADAAGAGAAVGIEDDTDAAEDGGAAGAEDDKNDEHPDSAGRMAIGTTTNNGCRPVRRPRPLLQTLGRMGSSSPMVSLYPDWDGGLKYAGKHPIL
jgi:hypothetical protein